MNASKVTKVSIKQGSTKKLNWKTVSKRNRKKIRWKSSNRKIVSVSSNGTIRAKRTGKATVTAKYVAQSIADKAGGDLFEIEPKEPYTDDDLNWTDDNSRVSKEHDDESLRDVELTTTKVDKWDSYDTVFIGYPIWWAIAAWPVDNFVKNNDFSGKTVIPFCTSASSGIGESGQLLAEMAGTGDWKEGQRFSGSADDAEVSDWVKDLGYAK